jgi:hypothetical protein
VTQRGTWANIGKPGAFSTRQVLLFQLITELHYNISRVENRDYEVNRFTRGEQRVKFLFPGRFFPLLVTR